MLQPGRDARACAGYARPGELLELFAERPAATAHGLPRHLLDISSRVQLDRVLPSDPATAPPR